MKRGVSRAIFAGMLFAAMLPGLVPIAAAQEQRRELASTKEYLSKMDVDGDGKVSLSEYQDWMSYAFDAMDRNHDGVLSSAEQPGGRGKPVTRSEFRERLAERFRKQDLNHDGFLSARELAAPPQ
jgi:Ca2+-binding EF-hand superfamily protein